MRIQNNLKAFFEFVLCKKFHIIFAIAFCMPSVYAYAVYEDCDAAKPAYIEDNLCKIEVKNCKEDGVTLQLPEGSKIVATCNITPSNAIVCNRCPPGSLCPAVVCNSSCPTDPNECANDDESDGVGNYTNTARAYLGDDAGQEADADEIHSCEKIGETTIENNRCQMQVTSCKQGNEDIIPPGYTGTAVCDYSEVSDICTKSIPPSCAHRCPTNPNECANDNEGDNVTNYSNTESIMSVVGGGSYEPTNLQRSKGRR